MPGDRDEEHIRELASTWIAASKAGDVDTVLSLVSDDVVFLMPGRPLMRKAESAAAARAATRPLPFDGTSESHEITVLGDWAFMWATPTVVATSSGGATTTHAGHTQSALRRQQMDVGPDANMLTPDPS